MKKAYSKEKKKKLQNNGWAYSKRKLPIFKHCDAFKYFFFFTSPQLWVKGIGTIICPKKKLYTFFYPISTQHKTFFGSRSHRKSQLKKIHQHVTNIKFTPQNMATVFTYHQKRIHKMVKLQRKKLLYNHLVPSNFCTSFVIVFLHNFFFFTRFYSFFFPHSFFSPSTSAYTYTPCIPAQNHIHRSYEF